MKKRELYRSVIDKVNSIETPKGRRLVSILRGLAELCPESEIDPLSFRTEFDNIRNAVDTCFQLGYITVENAKDIMSVVVFPE